MEIILIVNLKSICQIPRTHTSAHAEPPPTHTHTHAHKRKPTHVQLSSYNHRNLSKVGSQQESGRRHRSNVDDDDGIYINLVDMRAFGHWVLSIQVSAIAIVHPKKFSWKSIRLKFY